MRGCSNKYLPNIAGILALKPLSAEAKVQIFLSLFYTIVKKMRGASALVLYAHQLVQQLPTRYLSHRPARPCGYDISDQLLLLFFVDSCADYLTPTNGFAMLRDYDTMSIFSGLTSTLSETKKVEIRQSILLKNRSINPKSSFFTPLLFDPDQVGIRNCENLIGQVSLPIGVAGPISSANLDVDGNITQLSDLLIPLATTEGALVASVNRGCKLLSNSHNVIAKVEVLGMTRAPVFGCKDVAKATSLSRWLKSNLQKLGKVGESTSQYLTFLNCTIFQRDNLVFARFSFDTGEAMGMNMVTIATAAIAQFVISANPGTTCLALSSNVCTDKKVSTLNRKLGRSRRVIVTANIPNPAIISILKTTPAALATTYHAKIIVGSRLAGTIGRNMQLANVAAALLAATGQDIAHTVDISQGSLSLRVNKVGVFAKLTLPTVPIGTVGGGTYLEAQTTARNLISNQRASSNVLAATVGLACLAGELSGLAALSTNTLAVSHERLGRL